MYFLYVWQSVSCGGVAVVRKWAASRVLLEYVPTTVATAPPGLCPRTSCFYVSWPSLFLVLVSSNHVLSCGVL